MRQRATACDVNGSFTFVIRILGQSISLLPLHLQFHLFLFCVQYRDARVVCDAATGTSRGYGFVSFVNKIVSMVCQFA